MDNIKNKPSLLPEGNKIKSFKIIPQDVRQLPVGTKIKINCTYPWQSNEGVIVKTPEGKKDKFGQWIDNGNYVAHYPYCRLEEVGEKREETKNKQNDLIIDLGKKEKKEVKPLRLFEELRPFFSWGGGK